MKIQYRHNRLEMLPEGEDEERFAQLLHRLVSGVSNDFMSWWGDVEFDGKETSGYVITKKPSPAEMESLNKQIQDVDENTVKE